MKPSAIYAANRFRSGMGQHLVGRVVFACANFASLLILVRWMSVADYAAYTAATALVTLLTAFSVLGIDRITSRFLPEFRISRSRQQVRSFIYIVIVARLVTAGLSVALVMVVWRWISEFLSLPQDMGFLLPIMIYALSLAMVTQVTLCLQSLMRQQEIRVAMSWQGGLRVGAIIVVALLWPSISPEMALWILGATECCSLIWLTYALIVELRDSESGYSKTQVREGIGQRLLKVAAVNYVYYLVGQPSQNYFLKLVAAAFLTPEVVAAYGFLHTIADRVRQHLPTNLFMPLIEPAIVSRVVGSGDMRQASRMIGILLKVNAMLLLPAVVWTAIDGPDVVAMLSGHRYGMYGWILCTFLLQALMSSHTGMFMLLANAADHSEVLPASSGLALLLSGTATITLFPIWGVGALAFGGTIYILFNTVFQLWLFRRAMPAHNYSVDWYGLARLCLFAMIAAVPGYLVWWETHEHGALPVAVSTAVVVFATFSGLCVVLKVFDDEERVVLKKLVGRVPIPV